MEEDEKLNDKEDEQEDEIPFEEETCPECGESEDECTCEDICNECGEVLDECTCLEENDND